METEAQQIAREQVESWMVNPGVEIVPQRGVYRLVKYKKTFAEDVLVKKDGVPLILKSSGRPLRAVDVYPERADLALDMNGNLLSQGDFQARYTEWLSGFLYPEGTEVTAEPIPEVSQYVSVVQDSYSESSGWIETYFDPKLNQEWTPQERFDTEGRERGDKDFGKIGESRNSVADLLLQAMLDKLDPDQVAEILKDATGTEIPIVKGGQEEAEEAETVEVSELVTAPCGKSVKARGLKAHIRFCGKDACGGKSPNSRRKENEAA